MYAKVYANVYKTEALNTFAMLYNLLSLYL